MTVFKIECEWDMGFYEAYAAEELAWAAINSTDWETACDMTLEEVLNEGLVSVTEIKVKGE